MVSDRDRKATGQSGRAPKRSTTIDLEAREVARADAAKAEKAGASPVATPAAPTETVPPNVFEPAVPEDRGEPAPVEPDVAEPAGLPRDLASGEAEPVHGASGGIADTASGAGTAATEAAMAGESASGTTGSNATGGAGDFAESAPAGETAGEPAPADIPSDVSPEGPSAAQPADAAAGAPRAEETPVERLSAAANPMASPEPRAHAAGPAPQRDRTALLPLAIAACLGGVVALGGAYALVGTRDSGAAASVAALEARLGEMESRLNAPAEDDGTAARLDALEAGVAEARRAAEAAGEGDAAGALARLEQAIAAETAARESAAAEATAAGEAQAAAVTALDERAGTLEARLGELETAVAAIPKEDLAPAVRTLESRAEAFGTRLGLVDGTVADLSPAVAQLKTAQDELRAALETGQDELRAALETDRGERAAAAEANDTRVAAIEERLGAIDELRSADEETASALAALGERADAATAATGERIDGLEQRLADTGGTLGTVDERLAAVETVIARAPEEGEIAALSLAVTTLAGKVARGAPFSADLAAVKATASDLPGIDALDPFAETGVPSAAAITESFPEAEVRASEVVAPDAAPVDRLLAGARRLVNFRETGAGDTETVGSLVGEIREKLAASDLSGAHETWERLPPEAKEASAEWERALAARIAADGAIAALTDRMVDRLSVQVNRN